jgi:hypothetical protein
MSVSNTLNPHALDEAQSPNELFEIMQAPSDDFDPYNEGLCRHQHLPHVLMLINKVFGTVAFIYG